MTMRDDLAAELAACHEANEVDMPFWRAVASDVIGAGWRPRETYTTDSAEALAEAIEMHSWWPGSRNDLPGCYCGWRCDPIGVKRDQYAAHVAQALIASGAVRPAAEVRAEAWDEGYTSGFSNAMRRMSDELDAPTTPNPYRAALAEEGDRG